ncbi:hypothetical protein X765_32225 [Mesorhizobium sp. LSHC440B00]|nr:hypothetical protein X765_32225 [Mesorhizobium sp. LSHC440B00]
MTNSRSKRHAANDLSEKFATEAYGMGYNFSGILGTTFGRKIAGRILGEPGVDSMFATRKFPTMPLYSGRPWFLGLLMRYFDWHDCQIARRGT